MSSQLYKGTFGQKCIEVKGGTAVVADDLEEEKFEPTPESRREEYRTYMENSGAARAIRRVLQSLYLEKERPPDPVEYVKKYLGNARKIDWKALVEENKELIEEREQLQMDVERLVEENTALAERLEELGA